MFDQLAALLAVAMILLAACGLGWPLGCRLEIDAKDVLARLVWSVAIGLVLAAGGLAVLCLFGPPSPLLIAAVTLASSGSAVVGLLHARIFASEAEARSGRSWPEDFEASDFSRLPPRWIVQGVIACAALACFGALVTALAPPLAAAAAPHLDLAKALLNEGMLGAWPRPQGSASPALVEMWYLWALALDGAVASQLLDWALGVLLALATVLLARSIVGRSWAWPVGGVVALVPAVQRQWAIPGSGVALALLTTLALAAWWHAVIDGRSRRWLAVAGLMAGAALAISPLGAAFLAALGVSCLWAWWRQPQRRTFLVWHLIGILLLATVIAGPWYAIAAWRGVGFREMLGGAHFAATAGPEYQLGTFFPAALPGLLIARRLRGVGLMLSMALIYAGCWYLGDAGEGRLLPIVPLLAIATVWVWIEIRRFPHVPRRMVAAVMAALVVVSTITTVARSRPQLAVAFALETSNQYLGRHDPTWPAAEVANLMFRRGAHLLSEEPNTFWFNCRTTREDVYRGQSGYDSRLLCPADLSRTLRESGFTHLLLVESRDGSGVSNASPLARLVEAQWAGGDRDSLPRLLDYLAKTPDGRTKRYRLVMVANQH